MLHEVKFIEKHSHFYGGTNPTQIIIFSTPSPPAQRDVFTTKLYMDNELRLLSSQAWDQPCLFLLVEFCTCLATRPLEKKNSTASLIFNASLTWEIKPHFLSVTANVFFHKPCYGGQILGDVFPCLSAEPVGHWAGLWALWHTTWKAFQKSPTKTFAGLYYPKTYRLLLMYVSCKLTSYISMY